MPFHPPRLRDRDVRAAIHEQIVPGIVGTCPSKVVDEFALCLGESRIDIAVVNGRLHGIEIKSDADTLDRLDSQGQLYGRVFDTVTLVCGSNHLKGAKSRIPKWWGIYTATANEGGGVRLRLVRQVGENPRIDPISLVQFLWKEEILALLAASGRTRGTSGKSRRQLWPLLVAAFPVDELREKVRECLKIRKDWRPDSP